MDYIKRLFILIRQRTKRSSRHPNFQRPDALEKSLLAKLPAELLQQVANNLPVASAASFSLSCRQIHLLIGTQYIENLAKSSHETLAFLKLLEHDLQGQIVCDPCRKLHRIKDARKYTGSNYLLLPCLSYDHEIMATAYIQYGFSTTVFKMAMKHYRQFGYDAESRQLLNLLSGKLWTRDWGAWVEKQKVECQIKNGSLLICKRITFHGTCSGFERHIELSPICPHLEYQSNEQSASLCVVDWNTLEEKWSMPLHSENSISTDKTTWNLCSELHQCQYCRTEYKVDFQHDDGCTINLTITIWKDLGQGPEADEWKAHLSHQDLEQIHFNEGEIASAFQDGKV